MTQPLNYTTKAIDDMMSMAKISPNEERKKGLLFVADLLRRAEVFVLPERGELIDRSKPYPEVPATVYRPAFPVVALEYPSTQTDWQATSIYRATPCSRRIALAWQWDGQTPFGPFAPAECPPGEGVFVASVGYYDHVRRWVPVFAAPMIRYDARYVVGENSDAREALIHEGRFNARHANARVLESEFLMPILPDALSESIARFGRKVTYDTLSVDVMDELNAYRDLCLALACNNVRSVRNAQPEKLNKSRIRMGRPPLKDFHILEIAGHGDGVAGGFGPGGGMRSHLRRGHIRRLGPERITWVNSCMVRGSRQGFVDKQYAVPEVARHD